MPLNTAGINAILEDGNEAVVWVAIGDGDTHHLPIWTQLAPPTASCGFQSFNS